MPDEQDAVSLTDALEEASTHTGSQWLIAGLAAAVTASEDERQEFTDWRLQDQTELDLHLSGPNVQDHETRADWLGMFMRRSATAVKELAKDISGLSRHAPGLLVEGPGPGSVRVVFRTPSRQPKDSGTSVPPVETLDGKALHQFASIFMLAEEEDTGLLDASVERLAGRARNAVRSVGNAVADAAFEIEGDLIARGHRPQRLTITPISAARVVRATNLRSEDIQETTIAGEVDGWTWSKSVMDFAPFHGRPFRAVVPPTLQEVVASINGHVDHQAVAIFLLTRTYPLGDTSSAKHSYLLRSIQAQPAEPPPELFEELG